MTDERPALLSRLDPSAMPRAKPFWPLILVLVMIGALLPWMLDRMEGGNFALHLLITFFVWGVVTQCWNLIMGVSGIYSFGQLALYAVGGFTTGTLSKALGWNPWFTLWLAPVAAVAAALVIGLPTLRLRGVYVILLTIAFHELVVHFVTTGPQVISNGGVGLLYVPKLGMDQWMGGGKELVFTYYLGFAIFAVATAAVWWIIRSPIGLAFMALRDSEGYAVSRGVNPFRFKLLLFAFSAFFTGLAGGFMTHYQGTISPQSLGFGQMILLLAMIVLGGWGTFWGPIFGTALLTVLPELLRRFDQYRTLTLGLVLVLMAVLAPQGLVVLLVNHVRRTLRVFREVR